MSYQSIYRSLYKKASSEQLRKLARWQAEYGEIPGTDGFEYIKNIQEISPWDVLGNDGSFWALGQLKQIKDSDRKFPIKTGDGRRKRNTPPTVEQARLTAFRQNNSNGGVDKLNDDDEGWRNATFDKQNLSYRNKSPENTGRLFGFRDGKWKWEWLKNYWRN